jgi:DNA polymerase III subunit epsilon
MAEELIVMGFIVLAVAFILAYFMRPSSEPHNQNSMAATLRTEQQPAQMTPSKGIALSALLPEKFVVLDLETTGLKSATHEIIEIGAIRVNLGSSNHEAFSTLVKPERRIPKRIVEITGITQKMIDDEGTESKEALGEFIQFIGDLPLVTYNAEFDMAFLYAAARKHGFIISNQYTCALKRARRAWPGRESYRLADIAKAGNLSDEDTHRALGDCKRALIVFTAATSELGQKVRWSKPQI